MHGIHRKQQNLVTAPFEYYNIELCFGKVYPISVYCHVLASHLLA